MNLSHFFLLCLAGGFLLAAAHAKNSPGNDSRVLMDEMTTAEVRDAIHSGKTTVLLFNASTEASGPHLVLGKHIFRARYLGERITRELGNALVAPVMPFAPTGRSEEHTSELQSRSDLVCRLLLEKKKKKVSNCSFTKKNKNKQNT